MPEKKFRRKIKAYYTENVAKEWRRLKSAALPKLEFDTTMHLLKRYLPKRGLILDAGGGPGRYAFTLAKSGYEITLFDFTKANLDFAVRKAKREHLQNKLKLTAEGSLNDLSIFKSNSFDAVICLGGPLSHVMSRAKREKAAEELIRVAKHGAPILVSVMNSMSSMIGFVRRFQNELEASYFNDYLETGDYPGGYGFTAFHGFKPEELEHLFEDKDVNIMGIFALEGFASYSDAELGKLRRNPRRFNIWMKAHYKTINHPSSIGISQHMMIVCRKR